MKILNEFKKFISRGNIIDLAVGVIIGGAFSKIVTSLVNDIINPIIGIFLKQGSLSTLKYVIEEGKDKVPEVAINYGLFIQTIINFLIIAFVLFLFVMIYNKTKEKQILAKKKAEEEAIKAAENKLTLEQELLKEIRDLLKNK